jgi:hypothetical protein
MSVPPDVVAGRSHATPATGRPPAVAPVGSDDRVGELQRDPGPARVGAREASGRRQTEHALLRAVVDNSHHRVGRADTALRCRPSEWIHCHRAEVIAVTEPHNWPFEQPAEGTLRPWYLTATGFLMVLFSHPEEAQRARSGLLEHGVSQEDIRLYESGEILRILARAQKERSILAKAVFALAADPSVKQRVLDNARTGGAALWLVAPTRDRADHLVGLLADYDYSSLRYYGEEGVADVHRDDG